MRRVSNLYREDAAREPQRRKPSKAYSVALIGSSGAGKSVLFFLAALYQAQKSNTMYHRRSGEEPTLVFVLTPSKRAVRIWFTRSIQDAKLARGHSSVIATLEDGQVMNSDNY
jgi:ABC-type nitrate/sulfonate/bicarbonate transport system ATPase subunit